MQRWIPLLLTVTLLLQSLSSTAYGAGVTIFKLPPAAERTLYPPVPGSLAPVFVPPSTTAPYSPGTLSPDYILGPGDQLAITDFGVAEGEKPYSQYQTVAPDGSITVNPVGVIKASGHTLKSLNDLINSAASKYETAPEIRISLAKPRTLSVYVLGDVERPGLISVEADSVSSFQEQLAPTATTGTNATGTPARTTDSIEYREIVPRTSKLTVLTAIQLAGGLNDTADVRRIRVSRRDPEQSTYVNLWGLLVEGDISQDIELRPGDSVFVARTNTFHDGAMLGFAADRTRRVRVWGGVKNAGIYELKPEDDLYSVIAKAGGFTESAITGSVLVSRLHPNGTITSQNVKIPAKDVFFKRLTTPRSDVMARTTLQDGDVVIAAESTLKKAIPRLATTVGAAVVAVFLLYLSRNIQDRSQTRSSTVRLF